MRHLEICGAEGGGSAGRGRGGVGAGDSSKLTSKTFSASLIRPKSVHGMYSLLNGFMLTCHAFGLCNVLAMGPFLEDVIYEPIRTGALPWMVAFESLILYLRLVENGTGAYNIANVVQKIGGTFVLGGGKKHELDVRSYL